MGKSAGSGGKKAAGNAKKAENAAIKAAAEQAKVDAAEDAKWNQGSKSTKKADDAAAKKAEAERKKAQKAMLLEAEEAAAPSKPKNNKTAPKKGSAKPAAPSRGLDLGQLDDDSGPGTSKKPASALNASGIDNALDALSLTASSSGDKIEKHPERRFKAAYAAFEARRLPEIEEENPGLRRNQRIELARKEFEKHPDNPFNQVSARYDSTREEIAQLKSSERKKVEDRLAA